MITGDNDIRFELPFSECPEVLGLVKHDLTAEESREYELENGKIYRIDNPVALYLRKGGATHRIVDNRGTVHCIPFTSSTVLRWVNWDRHNPVQF